MNKAVPEVLPWEGVQAAAAALAPQPPHGFMPWARPGGHDVITTRSAWDALRWNPPHHAEALKAAGHGAGIAKADAAAGAKPSWAAIAAEHERAEQARLAASHLVAAHAACEHRIAAAYGAHSPRHEIQIRLAAASGASAGGDAERVRLIARYRAVKRWLYPSSHATASYTLPPAPDKDTPAAASLAAFDPDGDAVWAKSWTPPA